MNLSDGWRAPAFYEFPEISDEKAFRKPSTPPIYDEAPVDAAMVAQIVEEAQ